MMLKRRFFIWLWAACLPFSAAAAPEIAVSEEHSQATIRISIPDGEHAKVFLLQNPDRLVADVKRIPMTAAERHAVGLPKSYSGRLVKGVRYGLFDENTSRFVFDLNWPVELLKSSVQQDSLIMEVGFSPGDKKRTGKDYTRPKKNGKPLIVIDPGHGGQDPGTIAHDGMQEKEVVLLYAKKLKEKLLQSGNYDVVLTRGDDRFIVLRDRFAVARKHNADLFISLHADSAPDDVRGISIYTVSEQASDQEAEALAARENKADVLADMDLSDEREDVAGILISLAQRETNNRSALFADLLVVALSNKVQLVQRSHRFAGFAVLKAPDVPSVLVELGFLSHPKDAKLLRSKAYRDKVTDGIATGIDSYFRKKKQLEHE